MVIGAIDTRFIIEESMIYMINRAYIIKRWNILFRLTIATVVMLKSRVPEITSNASARNNLFSSITSRTSTEINYSALQRQIQSTKNRRTRVLKELLKLISPLEGRESQLEVPLRC